MNIILWIVLTVAGVIFGVTLLSLGIVFLDWFNYRYSK